MPELNWLAIIVAAVVMVVVSTAYYIIFGSQLKALSAAYADAQSRPPWNPVRTSSPSSLSFRRTAL